MYLWGSHLEHLQNKVVARRLMDLYVSVEDRRKIRDKKAVSTLLNEMGIRWTV